MPDFSDSMDPYVSPVEVAQVQPRKTTGLKIICILAIILGVFGTLAALAQGVGLAFGQKAQAAMAPQQPGVSDEMVDLQQQMQDEINAVTSKFIVPSTIATLLHLLTAVLLLVGGIMTLKLASAGPRMLTFASAAAILYVFGAGILNAFVQMQTLPIIQSFMPKLMAGAGNLGGKGAGAAAEAMPQFLTIGIFVGLAFAALIALAKIIFYSITIFYLRKSEIRVLFDSGNADIKTI